ncbi:UbiA prenyltransferase family-domain-containing protein [Truncatella angustata]|uniref:UbiA prenyltransferase family-domain-containing protein n=1 Tax=Truncatella angustata TaxID=152316 RepID=A0A9P8ZV74_9PEZI|nr:UbiA prenyltransferase family-domain-containing protein [Truncatella angustata]KAH6648713.1 UbiA prenyltransferase family-domain-containing protein [Truncatella angustata]
MKSETLESTTLLDEKLGGDVTKNAENTNQVTEADEARSSNPITQLREIISLAHLITESNIKAYVLPVILFAMCSVGSGGVTSNPHPGLEEIAWAFPRVSLYIWLYVFHFDLSNQKDPDSIEEDRINKPWRAIPSGRLSIKSAEQWYKVATALLVLASGLWLGGFPEALAFMAETYIYDYASGASSWWAKNLINALFYSTGQLGGTRVAAESMTATTMTRVGYEWCLLLGLCTFSTVQIQDLRDVEGDRIRGRATMPLAFGDAPTRWITALFIMFWSVACPAYWGNGAFTAGYILPLLIGGYVSFRVLAYKSVKADRLSFHCHTLLWLPALYSVPLLSKLVLVNF